MSFKTTQRQPHTDTAKEYTTGEYILKYVFTESICTFTSINNSVLSSS